MRMIKTLNVLFFMCVLLFGTSCADHFSARKEIITTCKEGTSLRKVLFIGIDGVRTDALQLTNTPAIDSLLTQSYVSWNTDRGPYTVSVPGWTSILHGVWPAKHGLTENSFKHNRYQHYPDLFARVKSVNNQLSVATCSHWDDFLKITSMEDFAQRYASDADLSAGVKSKLGSCCPDILLMHFDDTDHAGHTYGFSPDVAEYIDAIETVDGYIQEIMNLIRNREQLYNEEWMVVLTTDHGGEGTGHGGQDDLPQTRKVWSIVRIPSLVSPVLQASANSVDLLPTMMNWMGVDPANFSDLDGTKFF